MSAGISLWMKFSLGVICQEFRKNMPAGGAGRGLLEFVVHWQRISSAIGFKLHVKVKAVLVVRFIASAQAIIWLISFY